MKSELKLTSGHTRTYDVVQQVIQPEDLPGGGYVFNQEHNIMPDVPAKNIVAMYNAIKEFNGQPLIKLG